MPSNIHPSRLANLPPSATTDDDPRSPAPKASRKRKRPRLPSPSSQADPGEGAEAVPSTGALRTAVRNLERLLARVDRLPEDVRVVKERELQHRRLELEERREKGRRGKMVARYHRVRFFERQKATRQLKKLRTQLSQLDGENDEAGSSEERERLAELVHEAEVDLNYTIYSPLVEKYVGIIREGAQIPARAPAEKRREVKPPAWFLVERAMKEGKLDLLRESKWPPPDAAAAEKARVPVQGGEVKGGKDSVAREKKKKEKRELLAREERAERRAKRASVAPAELPRAKRRSTARDSVLPRAAEPDDGGGDDESEESFFEEVKPGLGGDFC